MIIFNLRRKEEIEGVSVLGTEVIEVLIRKVFTVFIKIGIRVDIIRRKSSTLIVLGIMSRGEGVLMVVNDEEEQKST